MRRTAGLVLIAGGIEAQATSEAAASAKLAVCASMSASDVSGEISAML
jgi:hypothetical protein